MLAALPLAIAADGVMVPDSPVANTPKGKTQWQEIKIALLTRLGSRINRAGATVPQRLNRRLVAVLGDTDLFTGNSLATLLQVQAYFQRHHHHIRYQHFEHL
jgi:hypothetical protein